MKIIKKDRNYALKYVFFAIFLISCDQLTKYLFFNYDFKLKSLFYLQFNPLKNYGLIFGIGKNYFSSPLSILLLFIFGISGGCYLYYYYNKNIGDSAWGDLLLVFIISGIIGNISDRLILGYIRDFINFTLIGSVTINLSDIFLSVGLIIFIYCTIKKFKKRYR